MGRQLYKAPQKQGHDSKLPGSKLGVFGGWKGGAVAGESEAGLGSREPSGPGAAVHAGKDPTQGGSDAPRGRMPWPEWSSPPTGLALFLWPRVSPLAMWTLGSDHSLGWGHPGPCRELSSVQGGPTSENHLAPVSTVLGASLSWDPWDTSRHRGHPQVDSCCCTSGTWANGALGRHSINAMEE